MEKHILRMSVYQGQYDQRADSAQQCLMLLNNKQDVVIKSGKIVVLEGSLCEEELNAVRKYLINPVEMREKIFLYWNMMKM